MLATLIAAAGMLAQGSQDYPQWRGRDRDGSASAFIAPTRWPEALTRRWKVEIGEGYATPLVIGEAVYTFTRRDGREVMAALDAKTGSEKWQSSYAAPYTPSQPAAAHGAGPKATPLFHEGKLFTLGISGIVSAFDPATGKRLWQTTESAEPPFYSAASSPVGEKGVVIVHPGNYGPLTAFDTGTGQVKWTAGGDGFFASPIVVTLGGTRQVVSATQSSVIGVSLGGVVLWRYPWAAGSGSTTPVLHEDTIIVSGLNMGTAAFKPIVRDGNWVAETVWATKDVAMYVSNPVVIADTLFGLSHKASGQFFALDARTGRTLWLGHPREAENTAVVKAGDILFLLNDDGELIVARNSRSGFEPIVRYVVADSATWAQPTISGNRIFVKSVTSLALWSVDDAAVSPTSSPARRNGRPRESRPPTAGRAASYGSWPVRAVPRASGLEPAGTSAGRSPARQTAFRRSPRVHTPPCPR
jgi:outer membrane protein assembly factor BamB